jgi:predicted RND superfamily exporter protein
VVGLPVAASRGYELISADRYLASLAGIVAAAGVLAIGLRSGRYALRAALAAALTTGWALAGLWALGIPLNPLTAALGSLATVTACEFTVLLAADAGGPPGALRRVARWACLTSALGYLALLPSQVGLLREFGLTLAVTTLLSYLAAHAVVRLLPRRRAGAGRTPPAARIDARTDHGFDRVEVSS